MANEYFNHTEFRDLNGVDNTKSPLERDVIADRKISKYTQLFVSNKLVKKGHLVNLSFTVSNKRINHAKLPHS